MGCFVVWLGHTLKLRGIMTAPPLPLIFHFTRPTHLIYLLASGLARYVLASAQVRKVLDALFIADEHIGDGQDHRYFNDELQSAYQQMGPIQQP